MNRAKTAGIVIAAVFLAIVSLSAAVWMGIQGGTRDTIVLPEPEAPAEPGLEPAPSEALFVTVSRENVQAALAAMERPAAYHQVLTVTSLWQGGAASSTVELWRSGGLARAQITDQERIRNVLTDGETVWVWYQDDENAAALTPDDSVRFDDLAGIPTYETLTAIPPADVLDAGFLTLDEQQDVRCLYIAARDGGHEDRYWVDTATQLLYRADSLTDGEQTYQLRQISCEVITAEDDALQDVFRLPDGTAVTGA